MGLLKTAATVAVASSVHGRVQRRQQARWAAQDQASAAAVPAPPPPQYAAPPPYAEPVPPQAPASPPQPAVQVVHLVPDAAGQQALALKHDGLAQPVDAPRSGVPCTTERIPQLRNGQAAFLISPNKRMGRWATVPSCPKLG